MATNTTTSNLLWGVGNVYVAPFGSTEPTGVAAPTTPWVALGATSGGVKLTLSQSFDTMNVDQVLWTPESRLTAMGAEVTTTLAELTQANLMYQLNAMGALSAGTGISTFTPNATPSVGAAPTYIAVLFDCPAPGTGKVRRFVGRKCLSTDNLEMENKKDDQSTWGLTLTCHWVSDSVAPYVLIDSV